MLCLGKHSKFPLKFCFEFRLYHAAYYTTSGDLMGEETLGRAVLALSTDDSGLDKGLNAAHGKTTSWVGSVGKVLGGLAIGMAVIKGVDLLVDSFKGVVAGAVDAQNIQTDLAATLLSTKGASGMTAKSINELAKSLQAVTPYEDDVIVSGENMLLTFTNIGSKVFPKATEAMLNMSKKMGTDLQGSAIQLGKALNDPIKGVSALTRVGVTFTDAQKAQIKTLQESGNMVGAQTIILKELEVEFGGVARAAGTTFAGQMDILNNQINGVKDDIGTALLPVLTDLATKLGPVLTDIVGRLGDFLITKVVPAFAEFAKGITYIIEIITGGKLGAAIDEFGGPIAFLAQAFGVDLPAVFNTFDTIIMGVVGLVTNLKGVLQGDLVAMGDFSLGINNMFSGLGTLFGMTEEDAQAFGMQVDTIVSWFEVKIPLAITFLKDRFNEYWPLIKQAVTDAWILIQPTLIELKTWLDTTIPAAIIAVKGFWDGTLLPIFRNLWDSLKNADTGILPAGKLLVDWLSVQIPAAFVPSNVAFDTGTKGIGGFKTGLTDLVQPVRDFLKALDDIAKGLNSVQTWANNAGMAFGRFLDLIRPYLGGPLYNIPGFATGTSYAPGGFARVGENGPEVVALPRGSQVYPNGQGPAAGDTITINQTFAFGTPDATRQAAYSGAMSGLDVARARGLR